jgi:lipopolysaccharide export system protein LptA
MKIQHALVALMLLSYSISLHAQSEPGTLRLERADSLRGLEENGVAIIEALGNVKFAQDSATLTCDRARTIQAESRTEFIGNVMMHDGPKWLRADRVIAYEDRKIQEAIGQVALGDQSSQMTAAFVRYYQLTDLAIAEEEVAITNSERRVMITCGKAEYQREKEYSKATINPVLIEFDSLQNENMRITGEVIELFEGGARAKATGKVQITKQKTRATCEEAEYFREDGRLELRVSPIAWQERDELRGELIELLISNQKLSHVKVTGKATMTSPADTAQTDSSLSSKRLNSLSGGKMTLQFQDEQIERVLVEDAATSVYHVMEEGVDKGTNEVQGDRITLFLSNKELQRILIASKPGKSNGKFVPPGFVAEAKAEKKPN